MTDPELLRRAARDFGTPLYVYDGDAIGVAARAARESLHAVPLLKIYYSAKANPSVGIARLMRSLGMGLDACSEGDLRLAELAGFNERDISYTGFGLTERELRAASSAGALVLDSLEDINLAIDLGVARPIGLRINPEIAAGFHVHVQAGAPEAKFGLGVEEVDEALSMARAGGLAVDGLHCHVGSDVLDVAVHTSALDVLAELATRIASVTWLNLGGGFGTPRRPGDNPYPWSDLAGYVAQRLRFPAGRTLQLRLEPGSHCLMDAGVLVGCVLGVKAPTRGRRRTIVTDASSNQLVSTLLYAADHAPTVLDGEDKGASACDIVGNLMHAGDVLARDVQLPPVKRGDLITFAHAGAYASGRSTTFNERPPAAEAIIFGGEVRLLRRAGSIDELFVRDLIDPRPPREVRCPSSRSDPTITQ